MILLLLHGRPGVGKLTVGQHLRLRTGYGLFHNHLTVDLVASVFGFGTEPFIELREHIWLEVLRRSAEQDLGGLIFTFSAEKTVRESFIPQAMRVVREHGGDVVFIQLICDHNELKRRVEQPARRRYGKLASAERLDRLTDEGAVFDLAVPEGAKRIAVDNTVLSPEAAAEEIHAQLGHLGYAFT